LKVIGKGQKLFLCSLKLFKTRLSTGNRCFSAVRFIKEVDFFGVGFGRKRGRKVRQIEKWQRKKQAKAIQLRK